MTSAGLAERARAALADEFLRRAVRFTADRLRENKRKAAEALGRWEAWRERARAIRAVTLERLDGHLAAFVRNLEARGGRAHFAADAREAALIAVDIARTNGASLVVKSKSMVSEECGINHALEPRGIRCVETDLGEWIVQLAEEMPSHIVIPAIHKTREQILALFQAAGGTDLTPETDVLAAFARRTLREAFARAQIGMTGCNFAIAETGSVALFTNEGNGRMVSTLPGTHVVMMGLERIVPTWDDLEAMANVLPRSATGQAITTYLTVLTGPRRKGETDGPDALHVILVDNGRTAVLADPKFREVLHCIRCGACLNVCPVYRHIGGRAYAFPYSGPIGAVISPLLWAGDPRAQELADASSLCGACAEACPVKIPLHDHLVRLRRRRVEVGGGDGAKRRMFRLWSLVMRSPRLYRFASRMVRLAAVVLGRTPPAVGPLAGWAKHRDLPEIAARPYHETAARAPAPSRSAGPTRRDAGLGGKQQEQESDG